MRVIFFGTPDFAVPTLEALNDAGHQVVLVVSQPDKPAGRGQQQTAPPVAARAAALGLSLAQPRALRSGPFPERMVSARADVGVVVAYGRILPVSLLSAPGLGCINVHASLLPRWRGAAPIHHALLAGDAETGVCTQQMEEGLDTGPLWLSRATPIGARETAGALHDRLSVLAAEVALQTLSLLETGRPTPQAEAGVTWAPKIEKEHGLVRLTESAEVVDRRVRACSPWPGSTLALLDGALKLSEVAVVDRAGQPGEVLSLRPLIVGCGSGALELVRVQAPGRRPVPGSDWANGARLRVGDRIGLSDAAAPG